jgi:hypothetical protein
MKNEKKNIIYLIIIILTIIIIIKKNDLVLNKIELTIRVMSTIIRNFVLFYHLYIYMLITILINKT